METERAPGMTHRELHWKDGVPVSRRFGDVYFSRGDGLEEARHVFLNGNQLTARWPSGAALRIGELGFGSGLNFLATWQAWRQQERPGRLCFASVERYPLARPDLQAVVALWPELAPEAQQLVAAYPETPQGRWQHCWGNVELQVDFQEAAEALACWPAGAIEAWFLDGFSPKVNPDLWAPELLKEVFRITQPGGTGATYTVAGAVRRALQAAGFRLEKRPGFGKKREMLTFQKPGSAAKTHPEDASD